MLYKDKIIKKKGLMVMKSVRDFTLNGKVVILRCDFNVSIKDGVIIDNSRIVKSLDTINYILDNNAKLVILSHLGRIKDETDKDKYSMKIVFERLKELLGDKISFINEIESPSIKEFIDEMSYGNALLLENTRFADLPDKRESKCDMNLAKYWASLGDIFINDAFATLHRCHASNVGISSYLESGIGFLVEEELNELKKITNPKKPFIVIMGGAKVSDKIGIIKKLIEDVDYFLIGGAMAFTFVKALGYKVGKSLVEDEYLSYCKELLETYEKKIILPIDFYGDKEFVDGNRQKVFLSDIKDDFIGMDIGPKSIDLFCEYIDEAKTIFMNGPLGVYEFSNYKEGTKEVLKYACDQDNTLVIGGGDIVSCAKELNLLDKVTFASTGGGATLEYLENPQLVGLKNIKE